jgi:release factor glutamine methyltransferase
VRLVPLPGVFRPHSDSWLLADHVRRERLPPTATVLDLFTGSGLLAIAAAGRSGSDVVAVDVSLRATLAARINAALNRARLRVLRGDMFDPVRDRQFDLIVSNPPYVPGDDVPVGAHSPARAWEGGPSGRRFLDRLCAEAPAHLAPGGVLLLVQSSVCGERPTLDALRARGVAAEVVERRRGPLGVLLSARTKHLRQQGLIGEDGYEELLVIRGQASG